MSNLLPQQSLFLELLAMSGDIAVSTNMEGSILERTLAECKQKGWVEVKTFGAGFNKVSITDHGRALVSHVAGK